MPTANPEKLHEKAQLLKAQLAEKKESMEAAELRAMKKQIRRVQRKRRRLLVKAEIRAGKPAEGKKEE